MPDNRPDPVPRTPAPRFDDKFRAELRALFAWRRDVRRFRTTPLPPDCLPRLIHTARLAPSVGLSEPWRFVQVNTAARRARIRASFTRCNAAALAAQTGARTSLYAALKLAGFDEAPCQFALFSDHATLRWSGLGRLSMPETLDYSAVLALHTLWLAARAEGLGLGWVSILDPAEVTAALDVPDGWRFIGYFCLGWPETEDDTPELQRAGWEHRCDTGSVLVRR